MALTTKNFKRLLTTPGRYRDTAGEVKGLLLVVVNERNASWQLRYERAGKERWMGLGSARLIGLREARTRARAARMTTCSMAKIPWPSSKQPRQQRARQSSRRMTFSAAATAYHEHHAAKWKNRRHAAQFLSSLREYVFPVFGSLPLNDIDTGACDKGVGAPARSDQGQTGRRFWDTRQETASRVRRRIENVLDWATVRGYRTGDNPARWAGHLSEVLPSGGATRQGPALAQRCLMPKPPHSSPRCAAVQTSRPGRWNSPS